MMNDFVTLGKTGQKKKKKKKKKKKIVLKV